MGKNGAWLNSVRPIQFDLSRLSVVFGDVSFCIVVHLIFEDALKSGLTF
jgi:hypothetical protein